MWLVDLLIDHIGAAHDTRGSDQRGSRFGRADLCSTTCYSSEARILVL